MEPIKRVPLVHQVEERIEQLIADEYSQPGMKLPTEMELCQALGVSRGTVREAFRYLQAKGVVGLQVGKGAFVAAPKPVENPEVITWLVQNEEDLKNVIELRALIEPLAARKAAERCDEGLAERLQEIHKTFVDNAVPDKSELLAELDERFHDEIAMNCGNDFAIEIMKRLNDCMKSFRKNTFKVNQNIKDAITPHRNVMRAIAAHDPAKAEREMRKHVIRIEDNISLNIYSASGKDVQDT